MGAISVFTITQAQITTNVVTFTGSITSGTSPLISGTPIIVAGCTSAFFNASFLITGGNLTTTFTAALTHANFGPESESGAKGTYDPEGVQSAPSADTKNPLGFGVVRVFYSPLDPYGNFTPGTLAGTGQQISV